MPPGPYPVDRSSHTFRFARMQLTLQDHHISIACSRISEKVNSTRWRYEYSELDEASKPVARVGLTIRLSSTSTRIWMLGNFMNPVKT